MGLVVTYGTFDLLHMGHLRLLERAADFGDSLAVGVSTDEFNAVKGKRCVVPYAERAALVSALRVVTQVFPEDSWDQKADDITRFGADVFVMGSDWEGKFDHLGALCHVVYLPRTEGISTTDLRLRTAELEVERRRLGALPSRSVGLTSVEE